MQKGALPQEKFVVDRSLIEKDRKISNNLKYPHYENSVDARFIVQFSSGRLSEQYWEADKVIMGSTTVGVNY